MHTYSVDGFFLAAFLNVCTTECALFFYKREVLDDFISSSFVDMINWYKHVIRLPVVQFRGNHAIKFSKGIHKLGLVSVNCDLIG